MNRGGSTDSLDNDDNEIMRSSSGSSSYTNLYSSDEELNFDKRNINRTSHFTKMKDSNQYVPRQALNQVVNGVYESSINPSASTSYGQNADTYVRSNKDLKQTVLFADDRYWSSEREDRAWSEGTNTRKVGMKNSDREKHDTKLDNIDLGILPIIKQVDIKQSNPSYSHMYEDDRALRQLAIKLCLKLLECRNLIKAIEFVEENRDLIYDVTSIVREAPAFRNYDFILYQTDFTVKESFNQNFWLDREPVFTTADGNCQYHAVSISLTGSEAFTPHVRLATAVAVIDHRDWFDSMLKLIDRGSVLDLVHTIARNYSWGDETTLKAISVAIGRRIFVYTCNVGKKDYEVVKSLSKEGLLDAFKEKKYRGGTGIHAYADPLVHVNPDNYIMLFHKSEHFIAVLPIDQHPTMFEPYNPILPSLT